MIETYRDALNYLNSFLNLEKKPVYSYKESLKLNRVRELADHLKVPYQDLKAIHVAGTKGKGSTSHFLAYCLASLGYKVGLFSSPHFFTPRERIKTIEFKEDIFKEKLISRKKVKDIISEFSRKLISFSGEKPTYFELITLLGFRYFKDRNLDYVVVEVGLGGRLDSTNIINPKLSIITHIGYDHVHLLGNSLAQIAFEKAGIIKSKVPVISSCQRRSADEVIQRVARKNKAPLYTLGFDFAVKNVEIKRGNTVFDFQFNQHNIKNVKIYQKGGYQVENGALSLAAASLLESKRKDKGLKFKKALSQCVFEGRFELVSRDPLAIVDVAHNKSSAVAVSDNLRRYFPNKKVILIFSCANDKKPNQMLSLIKYNHLILTQFNQARSYDVFELKNILWRKKAIVTVNLEQALKEAKRLLDKQSLILICGSFYLAAEAKKIFIKQKNKEKKLLCPSLT